MDRRRTTDAPGADDAYRGTCSCCGIDATFVRAHVSLREGYRCPACGASNRYRGQGEALLHVFGDASTSVRELARTERFSRLRVFEPGISSPFRRYSAHMAHYTTSFYWPDVAPGQHRRTSARRRLRGRRRMRCEDLERLTFPDACFDLVITSDIFEHIRHPWVAFAEVHRVLVPGGVHVFSVPVQVPMRATTHYRVDTSGDDDVLLDTAVYHGDGAGGRSLVYVNYGRDIGEKLDQIGFDLELLQPMSGTAESRRLITFVATKR